MSIFDEQETKKPYVPGDFEVVPDGSHAAVLVAMIDLGTHTEEYQGNRSTYRKVHFTWELVEEKKKDGSNHVIGRSFTLSFADSAGLRKMIERWQGKKFPPGVKPKLTAMLGKPCQVTVEHTQSRDGSRTYANVAIVAPPPKSKSVPPPTRTPFFWDISTPTEIPNEPWLPYLIGEPLKDWIERSPEWRKRTEQEMGQRKYQQDVDEVIPTEDADPFPPVPEEKVATAPAPAPAPAKPKMRLPNDPATRPELEEVDALMGQLELDWLTAAKRCGIACEFKEITHGQYRLLRASLNTELEMRQPAY